MSQQYLMAIDAGTGSVRAVIFSLDGEQTGCVQREWEHKEDPRYPGSMDFDWAHNWDLARECVQGVLKETDIDPAQIAAVIYNSLAFCYGETVRELEEITGASYRQIHIVGGGANADYLNRLTARYTGRTVYAGPTEATAIGNLSAQMLHAGCYADLQEARNGIFHSFEIKEYQP